MEISDYILDFVKPDNERLKFIDAEYVQRDDLVPSIETEVGKILGLILRTMNATRIAEFGTCIGYSTIWLAEAMKATGGKVIAVEYEKRYFDEAAANIKAAGLSEYVELIHGDANEVVNDLEGPFDLILQDSAKPLYPVMLNRTIDLVRLNGILAADDGLFVPLGFEKVSAEPIHEYNQMVFADPRLYSTILPIGDGLTLSVKIAE